MSKWQEAAALVTLTLGLLACAGKQEQQALSRALRPCPNSAGRSATSIGTCAIAL